MLELQLFWTFFKIGLFTIGGGQGIGGAIMCTLGVVLPSLIIIVIIAKFFSRYMNKPIVQEVFDHVSGSVTGLLFSVVVTVGILVLFGMDSVFDTASFEPDWIAIGLFLGLLALSFVRIKKKKLPPIAIILLSALGGVLLYGFIPV